MEEDKKPSRRHRVNMTEPPMPWWLQQLRERPLATAGTVVSVIGGLLLLAFFCQLGRIPELDLAGVSAILMAVAVVGFALAAALTGCAFGTGLMMRGQKESSNGLGENRALALLIAPGMLSAIAFALYFYLDPQGEIPRWGYATPFVLLLILACVFAFLKPTCKANVSDAADNRWAKIRRGVGFSAIGYFWLLTAMSAFLTLFAFFPRDGDSGRFLVGLVGWTAWCYASNVVVAWMTRVNILAILGLCIAASLVALLGISGNGAGFPRAVVGVLGLGEVPVAMVLTSEGCDHLNKAAGGRAVCRVEPGEKTAVVCPAVLRSRIGSPLFVELSPYDENGRWPQLRPPERLAAIAIPKAEAPSWSQLAPMRAVSAPMTAAAGTIVTYLDPGDKGAWMRTQCGASPIASPASSPKSPS